MSEVQYTEQQKKALITIIEDTVNEGKVVPLELTAPVKTAIEDLQKFYDTNSLVTECTEEELTEYWAVYKSLYRAAAENVSKLQYTIILSKPEYTNLRNQALHNFEYTFQDYTIGLDLKAFFASEGSKSLFVKNVQENFVLNATVAGQLAYVLSGYKFKGVMEKDPTEIVALTEKIVLPVKINDYFKNQIDDIDHKVQNWVKVLDEKLIAAEEAAKAEKSETESSETEKKKKGKK